MANAIVKCVEKCVEKCVCNDLVNGLADINPHERDKLVVYEPGTHKYTCAGINKFISVTGWVHSHFPPFDADAIISKMMNKKNWSQSKYFGLTAEEIKATWDTSKNDASFMGTSMHSSIEKYYNINTREHKYHKNINEYTESDYLCINGYTSPPEHFIKFVHDNPNLKPFRTEWIVFNEDIGIAGTIDMVYEQPDGTLMIYDWKRCKDIKKTNFFGGCAKTRCVEHIPDTNYWHYALQLNMYKHLIESKYSKTVAKMLLVCLHPINKSYELISVPSLHSEMKDLIELLQNRN